MRKGQRGGLPGGGSCSCICGQAAQLRQQARVRVRVRVDQRLRNSGRLQLQFLRKLD